MTTREDLERVGVEATMVGESKLTLLEALKARAKAHEAAMWRAKTRVDACLLLAGRVPREASTLREVVKYWERVRDYHAKAWESSVQLGAEIARTLPDPPPGS